MPQPQHGTTPDVPRTHCDASVGLALFAERVRPLLRQLSDQQVQKLKEIVRRRRQLVDLRVAEGNRREQATSGHVKDSIRTVLDLLDAQLKGVDADLGTLVAELPELCRCSVGRSPHSWA